MMAAMIGVYCDSYPVPPAAVTLVALPPENWIVLS
jgi:hypothetical protein